MQNLCLERGASGGDWDIIPISFAGSNAKYKGVLGDPYFLQSDDGESHPSYFLEFPCIETHNDGVVVPDVPDSPTLDQFVFVRVIFHYQLLTQFLTLHN
jgi:hypothetical protein